MKLWRKIPEKCLKESKVPLARAPSHPSSLRAPPTPLHRGSLRSSLNQSCLKKVPPQEFPQSLSFTAPSDHQTLTHSALPQSLSGSEFPQTSSPSLTPAPPEPCSPRLSLPQCSPRFAPSEPLSHTGPSDPVLLTAPSEPLWIRAPSKPPFLSTPSESLDQSPLRPSDPLTQSSLKAWLPQPALPPSEPCSLSTPADIILLTAPSEPLPQSSLRSPLDL